MSAILSRDEHTFTLGEAEQSDDLVKKIAASNKLIAHDAAMRAELDEVRQNVEALPAIRALIREHPMECEKPKPVNSMLSFETATPCGVCVHCRINKGCEHA